MNHLKARQLKKSGRWHYTNKNDGRITPLGYCAGHDGHNTPEGAEACYKEYLLTNNLILDHKWGDLYKCVICEERTNGMASIPEYEWYVALCDLHRNQEEVERIFFVGESWQS